MVLTQQERYRLFSLLASFTDIWERNRHHCGAEIQTIHKDSTVEIRVTYVGYNYHDECWDCWEYVRAEKIGEDEFRRGKDSADRPAFEKPFDCLAGIAGHCYVCGVAREQESGKAAYMDEISGLPGYYRFTAAGGNNR